jgi:hypothetical protein
MSMANPPYHNDSAAAAAEAAARDRQKKSTMACEMCRKRKAISDTLYKKLICIGKMHFQRYIANHV